MKNISANDAPAQAASARKMMADHKHIIDDGNCHGHGYILPKDAGGLKPVSNSGVDYVDVPRDVLRKALAALSANQTKRIIAAGLA